MPTFRVIIPPTEEPVSLARLNSWCRLDLSADVLAAAQSPSATPATVDAALVADAQNLALLGIAARQKVEAHTGRFFAAQTVEATFFVYEPYVLPAGAEASKVTGFFTDLDTLNNRSSYLEEYRKGISVERELPFGVALQQTYTVTATVKPDPSFSALASRAILELAGEWYKNRESTGEGRFGELPVNWKVALAEARVNVLGID